MSNEQALENAQPDVRQSYVTPQLIVYGLVRELTAGGSIGTTEGSMMTSMIRHV